VARLEIGQLVHLSEQAAENGIGIPPLLSGKLYRVTRVDGEEMRTVQLVDVETGRSVDDPHDLCPANFCADYFEMVARPSRVVA